MQSNSATVKARSMAWALVGALAVVLIQGCDSSDQSNSTSYSDSATDGGSPKTDPCSSVIQLSMDSIRSAQSSEYAKGYVIAQKAVAQVDSCTNGANPLNYNQSEAAAAGVALSARAVNERHLPQGDSATDERLSRAFLARCASGDFAELSAACDAARDNLDAVFGSP